MGMNGRSAFSMIEICFAIVILGILSTNAMTKMSGTRTDAMVTKAEMEFKIVMQDFATYYLTHGKFANPTTEPFTLSEMTYVPLRIEGAPLLRGNFAVGTPTDNKFYCLHFHSFTAGGTYQILPNTTNDPGQGDTFECKQFLALPSVRAVLTNPSGNTTVSVGSGGKINRL